MAGEGYIPYGLDRSSKWADDISRARKAQQQAGIRQSLVGGEMIEQAMGTALNRAGKAYTMASDRYADHVGVQAKKKANLVRADAEVSNLDASIEALQKRIDAGIKDPLQYERNDIPWNE